MSYGVFHDFKIWSNFLAHLPLDKMADISQMIFREWKILYSDLHVFPNLRFKFVPKGAIDYIPALV